MYTLQNFKNSNLLYSSYSSHIILSSSSHTYIMSGDHIIENLSEKLYDTEMEIRDLFASLVVEECDEEELEELISRMRERFRGEKKTFSTPARSSAPWPVEWTPEYSSRVKKKEQEVIETPVRPKVVEKELSTDLRRQVLLKVKHRLKAVLQSPEELSSSPKI